MVEHTISIDWQPIMVLFIVGLGLGDEQDVTLRGLNAIRKSKKVFLENYTSVLGVEIDKLVHTTQSPASPHLLIFTLISCS